MPCVVCSSSSFLNFYLPFSIMMLFLANPCMMMLHFVIVSQKSDLANQRSGGHLTDSSSSSIAARAVGSFNAATFSSFRSTYLSSFLQSSVSTSGVYAPVILLAILIIGIWIFGCHTLPYIFFISFNPLLLGKSL